MTGPVRPAHHRHKAPRIKWSATIPAQLYKPRDSALVSSRELSGKCALNARSKPCPGLLSKPTGAFFAAVRLSSKHPSAAALQALAIH
jgi:hypothetical protein